MANARDCKHGQLARSCNICELEDEIRELKAHIKRWAALQLGIGEPPHKNMGWIDTCLSCGMPWPCPKEVARGWEE